MSEQVQEQVSPQQQQLANVKAAVSKRLEDFLDGINMLRDIPKLFEANISLDLERNQLKGQLAQVSAELEAVKAELTAAFAELEAAKAAKPHLAVVADGQ